jgi:hypothetical protein
MSDFLTHLIGRSQNRLPLVQPRLASRFENRVAKPDLGLASTGLREWEESLSQPKNPIFEAIYPSSPQPSSPQPLSLAPVEVTRRRTNPARSPAVRTLENDSSQVLSPETSENSSMVSGAIAVHNNGNQGLEQSGFEQSGFEQSGFEQSEIENGAIQPRLPEATNLIAPSIVRPQSSLPFSALFNASFPSVQPLPRSVDLTEQRVSPDLDALTAKPDKVSQALQPAELSILPASNRVQPQITPRPENFPVAAPPSPPTIQVTIGRIEVRAQTATVHSPVQSKPTPHRPALTLDRYLSQRSGGQA